MMNRKLAKHLAVWMAALLLLAAPGGCSMFGGGEAQEVQPQDVPPGETEEQAEARRRAEEERLAEEAREAEEARVAEAKRKAEEEARRATEVRETFGPVPEKPEIAKVAPPTEEPPPGLIPFEEGVPPLPEEPKLRVAVFSLEDQPEKGDQVALTLGTYHRQRIEDALGMALSIAYVSHLPDTGTAVSAIRFRPNYLKAALVVAAELPHRQEIGPMKADEMRQEDVDLVVYIGPNYN